ncbi:MAG: hypothetical protein K8L99_06360 [Anaerolineae bacterium]|nr:hypothetical protein [Anaerolineae bacterium]
MFEDEFEPVETVYLPEEKIPFWTRRRIIYAIVAIILIIALLTLLLYPLLYQLAQPQPPVPTPPLTNA